MKQQIEITVPNQWSAVTLKKYLELKKDMDNYAGEYEAVIACMFHHLCEFPADYIHKLDLKTYTDIVNDMSTFLANVELPLQKFITIDGVEYGFEPNLSKMAYGAYVDITKYETIEINKEWAEIMSILYRPVTNKKGKLYDIKAYDGVIDGDKFLNVGMDVHFGAIFFFKTLLKDLLSSTLKFSEMKMETLSPNIRRILERSGSLTQALNNLHVGIS
jgi:hypothetical protein